MSTTVSANDKLHAMTLTAEARARALQGAYIGEAISSALAAIGRTVASLYRRWRESRDLRRSIAYLEGLDERLLADIGLNRAGLEMELRDPTPRGRQGPDGRRDDRRGGTGGRRQPGPSYRAARRLTGTSHRWSRPGHRNPSTTPAGHPGGGRRVSECWLTKG